jgi:hypothetical protein
LDVSLWSVFVQSNAGKASGKTAAAAETTEESILHYHIGSSQEPSDASTSTTQS